MQQEGTGKFVKITKPICWPWTLLPGPEIFFRPVLEKSSAKSGKSPANLHIKRKTAFRRRVNKIVNNFFLLSLCVCHYSKRRKFFQKISSAPFLPLLTKFGHNSAINSSGQIFFSPVPFELFGRNFGHLATLTLKPVTWTFSYNYTHKCPTKKSKIINAYIKCTNLVFRWKNSKIFTLSQRESEGELALHHGISKCFTCETWHFRGPAEQKYTFSDTTQYAQSDGANHRDIKTSLALKNNMFHSIHTVLSKLILCYFK